MYATQSNFEAPNGRDEPVNLNRITGAAMALAGTLLLAACGSDTNNTGSSSGSSSSSSPSSDVKCVSGSIKASGSSAQKNAITQWINDYQSKCTGATIDYQANGSGAGIQDFNNKQTAFAGSDAVMKPEEQTAADARCATGKAIHLPMVGGAITLAYNVPGVTDLTLTPEVIAGIFDSTITKWNDPKISAVNKSAKLPDATIAEFHRSDSSGTTANFNNYLTASAGSAWKYNSAKDWTAPGGQGAKGSDGVTSAVKSTPNAIGYIELSFAQDAKLTTAKIDNGGGAVAASAESATKAIGLAQETGSGNNITLKLDYATKQAGAYPLVLLTYEITCEKGLTGTDLELTKGFLTYAAGKDAQAKLADIGYVPVADSIITKVRTAVAALS